MALSCWASCASLTEVSEGPLSLQFLSLPIETTAPEIKPEDQMGSSITIKMKVDTSQLENQISFWTALRFNNVPIFFPDKTLEGLCSSRRGASIVLINYLFTPVAAKCAASTFIFNQCWLIKLIHEGFYLLILGQAYNIFQKLFQRSKWQQLLTSLTPLCLRSPCAPIEPCAMWNPHGRRKEPYLHREDAQLTRT